MGDFFNRGFGSDHKFLGHIFPFLMRWVKNQNYTYPESQVDPLENIQKSSQIIVDVVGKGDYGVQRSDLLGGLFPSHTFF